MEDKTTNIDVQLVAGDDKDVKKSQKMYQNLSASRQSFDQIRFFQVINGNIVLRGQNGRRDTIYPLAKACQRFSRWFQIFMLWETTGFHVQCDELKQVLEQLGAKIQQAVSQRLGGVGEAPPPCCDAKFMAQLCQAMQVLK